VDRLVGWIAPLAIALVPAAVRLWRGRALARRLDDPAFPERLLKARQPMVLLAAAAAATLATVWPDRIFLTVPVLILSNFAASFPLRRAIYDETWSLATFLWFSTRLTLVLWGYWILLLLAPMVTNRAGWQGWAAAAAAIAIIAAFDQRFGDVARAVLRTRPIEAPDLLAGFAALVARSAAGAPRFDFVPMRGGVVANAVALPSLRRPGVVFTETLLERLSAGEVAAICAHELAHLEYFNARRLRRLRMVSAAFIVVGAVLAPSLRAMGRDLTPLVMGGWAMALSTYLVVLGVKRQKNETASDLRAIELGGDPEALISSLEKLNAYARLPRRWDQQLERNASHPSLARRVRDIRAAAGAAPLVLGETASFSAPGDAAASVTFHDDRLVWIEGELASFTMPYHRFTELRVEVGAGAEPARLIAVDPHGRRWDMGLAAADVARVQRVLDIVDSRLRSVAPASADAPVARLVAALAAVVALFAGQPAALVALFGFFDAAFPIAALSGMASAIAGGLVWRDGGARLVGDNAVWPMPVLLLCGAFLMLFAWRSRAASVSTNAWRLSTMAGVWCALCLIPIAAASVDLIGFHLAARTWSGFSILAFAFAISTLDRPARWARPAAAAAALAGLTVVAAGSSASVDLVIRDPLLLPSPPARELALDGAAKEAEFTIAVSPTEIRPSPGGRSIIVVEDLDEDQRRFYVGRAGGALAGFDADDAWFADDDYVIAAIEGDEATIVRRIPVDAPAATVWERHLGRVEGPVLSLNAAGTTWRVLGEESNRSSIGVEGSLASGAVSSTERWPMDPMEGYRVAASGDRLLRTDLDYRPGLFGQTAYSWGSFFNQYRFETRLFVSIPSGRLPVASSAFDTTCQRQAYGDGAVCTMFDGGRSHILIVELPSGRIRAVTRMAGRFFISQTGQGWIGGAFAGGETAAIHLATGAIVRVPRARGTFGNIATGAGDRIVTVSANAETVRVQVHRVTP
jgi:Zn-dependent protease with chaperone function